VAASTYLDSAEIFDPATGTSSSTGSMSAPRINHTATLLRDGRVLVAGGTTTGGSTLATAEIFNPVTDTFATPLSMAAGREQHTAALLANGQVLLAGGYAGSPPLGVVLSSAEIFDPTASGGAGGFATTHGMADRRRLHVATEVSYGRVLVAGGYGSSGSSIAEAETFAGPWAIDFEAFPGPDGLLGTADDVPTPVCPPPACPVLIGLGGQYASLGITFSQGTLFYESPPGYGDPWFSDHYISSTGLIASFSVPVREVSITSYSVHTATLTAYDASNNVLGTSVLTNPSPGSFFLGTLSLTTTQPIDHFSVLPEGPPGFPILNLDDLEFTVGN